MKKYLCRVYSADEYGAILYAYVEINEELKAFIASVLKKLGGLAKRGDFLRIEFLNYSPIFMESLPPAFEGYIDPLGLDDCVELPADTPAPECMAAGLDFSTIQIEEDAIRFTCRAKHSEVESETANLFYRQIGPELEVKRGE